MKHLATRDYWVCYNSLPGHIKKLADKNFKILKENPCHPSLHFKRIEKYRSIRIGRGYRALAYEMNENLIWFWIGTHPEYDKKIR